MLTIPLQIVNTAVTFCPMKRTAKMLHYAQKNMERVQNNMATKMIEQSNVLTLDFWEEDVIYEGKVFPAGTLACDALNIPDDVVSQMETLCKNLNQFMGIFDTGKANATLLPAARQSAIKLFAFLMAEDNSIRVVKVKLDSVTRTKKKIATAVYQYQADGDGEWGEIHFDFETGNAEIMYLA